MHAGKYGMHAVSGGMHAVKSGTRARKNGMHAVKNEIRAAVKEGWYVCRGEFFPQKAHAHIDGVEFQKRQARI